MDRFERTYVGEGLGRTPVTVVRLLSRKEREQGSKIEIGPHLDVHWDAEPRSQRVVNVGPNAPLLIRLVRYPFSMRSAPMNHNPLPSREALPAREPYGCIARDNAEAWARPAKHRPAKGRIRMAAPARPNATAWIGLGAQE
jgi:hypothetical protein